MSDYPPYNQQPPSQYPQYQPQPGYGQYGQQQPPSAPYGQPNPNPYGQPNPNPYGQPNPNPYGQPNPNPYGQPDPNSYGQMGYGQQQLYGQPDYSQSNSPTQAQAVGVGPRFLATLIDGILLFIIEAILLGITHNASAGAFFTFVIAMAYYIVMEGQRGATVGKMALGLRVVRTDGGPITMNQAVSRNLLRIVDALPTAYLLGAILIWNSPLKQRLGDRVAKTMVIRTR
jgi:uncharacterized RDD family membrane protein YckC